MTGIELISQERREQIEKHSFSQDYTYVNEELLKASLFCIDQKRFEWPFGWGAHFRLKIVNKSRVDQLKVAGAFIAAEIDRLQGLKEKKWEPKDGDIIFIPGHGNYADRVLIHKNSYRCYAGLNLSNRYAFKDGYVDGVNNLRPATPEEQQKLFDALEEEGWRWNAEKKELEKIPEPLKAGDLVIAWDCWKHSAVIAEYVMFDEGKGGYQYVVKGGYFYKNAVKFESMEQYEKVRRGEI